jgi:hypothetical protein
MRFGHLTSVAVLLASGLHATSIDAAAQRTPADSSRNTSPPEITDFQINARSAKSRTRNVQLTWSVRGTVTHYRVSEDATFRGVPWQAGDGSIGDVAYTLEDDRPGLKRLYLQIRWDDGEPATESAEIEYEPEPVPEPEPARVLFQINGKTAWEEARQQGFEFYPVPKHFLIVTSPRDGVDTRLQDDMPSGATVFARVTMGELWAYGGATGETWTYRLFAGRDLAPGWTIKFVMPELPAIFAVPPTSDSATPVFELKITVGIFQQLQAPIGLVVLEGPEGADWRDAFRK